MDKSQWGLLAASFLCLFWGLAIKYLIITNLEKKATEEPRPDSWTYRSYERMGVPGDQIKFYPSKGVWTIFVSINYICFLILSVIMAIAFIASFFV
jgi:hypothetical protein